MVIRRAWVLYDILLSLDPTLIYNDNATLEKSLLAIFYNKFVWQGCANTMRETKKKESQFDKGSYDTIIYIMYDTVGVAKSG